ncbi:MAG: cobalamin biosynthesis protein CbiX [Sandaracinaceae bacterium]|nr:cobalamin biosynthesis protein CbiX [Sandaracinaceae bacterium]
MKRRGIILIDHGSRRAEANAALETMASYLEAALGGGLVVAFAHMELAPPSLFEAARALVEDGVRDIVVFPYFLSDGRHVSEDIPQQMEEAAAAFPGSRFRLLGPLGPDRELAALIARRILAADET